MLSNGLHVIRAVVRREVRLVDFRQVGREVGCLQRERVAVHAYARDLHAQVLVSHMGRAHAVRTLEDVRERHMHQHDNHAHARKPGFHLPV